MNTQTKLVRSLILIGLIALTACGASKQDGTTDSSSRITSTSTSTTTSTSGTTSTSSKAVNTCNRGASSSMDVAILSYTSNNQINPSLMNVRLMKSPALESSGGKIYAWRWKASSTSVYVDDTAPVSFRIVTYPAGNLVIDGLNVLRWADLKLVSENLGYKTASDFFAHVRIIYDLKDPLAEFDAITLAYYDSSNVVVDSLKMLLPTFYSNPKNYATSKDGTARNPNLVALHPFKSIQGFENDENYFKTIAYSMCSPWM